MALANILPQECITLFELVQTKQFDKAQKLQAAIVALNNAVTRGFGVPGKFFFVEN